MLILAGRSIGGQECWGQDGCSYRYVGRTEFWQAGVLTQKSIGRQECLNARILIG